MKETKTSPSVFVPPFMNIKTRVKALTMLLVLLISVGIAAPLSGAEGTISEGDVKVNGLSLQVSPADQTVPANTPTAVETTFEVENGQLLKGMVVKGDLQGPGLKTSLTLTTLPNRKFSIPGLSSKGDYYLENIRLERDGKVLMQAVPERVHIKVMDIMVTKIETRALSIEEIREKGINITEENFTVYHFSVGIMVGSKPVTYSFPVVYSNKAPYIPAGGGGGGSSTGFSGGTAKQTIPFSLDLPHVSNSSGGFGSTADEAKLMGVLVFNNDIAFLNQFFSVMFIVVNNSPADSTTPLALKDITATLTLPEGLREAQTTPPHISGTPIPVNDPGPDGKLGTDDDLNIILVACSGKAEFLAEGLKEGTHIVSVDFDGTLTGLPGGDTPISGSASGAVVVRNPEFSVTFSHPEVIRLGEEYDIFVTMTNTSPVPANLVSLTMPAERIIGCRLLSQSDTASFDSIAPGASETAKFHMQALETGKVMATAFESEGGVKGQFLLTAGVGEHDIPLSPDTLVLPSYAYKLEEVDGEWVPDPLDRLLNTAMIALGEAYSIAVTPPGGLPEHLPVVDKEGVKNRIINLTEAGQRLVLGDTPVNSLLVLALDWLGNHSQRLDDIEYDYSFDVLRRLTTKDIKFSASMARIFSRELENQTPVDFHRTFAETVSYKNPFVSGMLSFSDGTRCAQLTVTDQLQNRLALDGGGESGDQPPREIPYGQLFPLQDQTAGPADFALIGRLDADAETGACQYTNTFEVTGTATGTFNLSLILPTAAGGFQQVTFSDMPCLEGSRSRITVTQTDTGYSLAYDSNGDGSADSNQNGVVTPVVEPALELISATQDCGVDSAGHVTALFFNRPISAATAKEKTNYFVENKRIYASFLQPSQRVILVGMDNPVSPFVESKIKVTNLEDLKGNRLSEQNVSITATIKTPGGVVYGNVQSADGKPQADARVVLEEIDGFKKVTHSYCTTDEHGDYRFDFVRILPNSFRISVYDTNGKKEEMFGRIRSHGQWVQMDIIMRGHGRIQGTVKHGDGSFADNALVFAYVQDNNTHNPAKFHRVQCDDSGVFVFPELPIGLISLTAVHGNKRGYAPAAITETGGVAEAVITLVDAQFGDVAGHVYESDGITPVAGTPVYIYRNDKPMNFVGSTDESGAFLFENVTIGTFTVHAVNPQNGSHKKQDGYLQDGQTADVRVVLDGHGSVSGTVKDKVTNAAAPGVTVYIPGTNFYMNTCADGSFTFIDVPIGNYNVKVYSKTDDRQAEQQIKLSYQGQEVGIVLELPLPAMTGGIQGTVNDIDGSPMSEGYVWIMNSDNRCITRATINSGQFRIDGISAGTYKTVFMEDDKAGVSTANINIADPLPSVEINLRGRGNLVVNVFNSNGETPIIAQVKVRAQMFKVAGSVGFFKAESAYDSTGTQTPLTISGIYTGAYTIDVESPFYGRKSVEGTLSTAGTTETINISMNPPGKLAVTVVDHNNQPVPGAKLKCKAAGLPLMGESSPITADANGQYTFTLIPYGGFYIEAAHPNGTFDETVMAGVGKASGQMGSDGATIPVTVKLRGISKVNITISDADGNAIADLSPTVTLKSIGYPVLSYTGAPVDERVYRFEKVYEGNFFVCVKDSQTGSAATAFGVVTGNDSDVNMEVRLTEWGSFVGTVFQPDNATACSGIQVQLYSLDSSAVLAGITSMDGTFRFDYITRGDYRLVAYEPTTGRTGQADCTIATHLAEETVSIRLGGRGTVKGTFISADGTEIIPQAKIVIKGNFPDSLITNTDSDGRYSFSGIPEGNFTVDAEDPVTRLWGRNEGTISVDEEEVTADITACPIASVTGTVYEADGESIVEGASIKIKSSETTDDVSAADGTFRVDNLPLGTYIVTAIKGRDKGTAPVTLQFNGQVVKADVVFQGFGQLRGIVKDGNDLPVTGVSVKLESGSETLSVLTSDGSDERLEAGEFLFEEVRMGPFNVSSNDETLAASDGGTFTASGQEIYKTLKYDIVGTISGTILDEAGVEPVPGAHVVIKGSKYILYKKTDENGAFMFNSVPLGAGSVEVIGTMLQKGLARGGYTLSESTQDIALDTIVLDNQNPAANITSPTDNQMGVNAVPAITIVFDEIIDTATLEAGLQLQKNGQAGSIALQTPFPVAEDGRTVTLTPVAPLESGAFYTIVVKNDITDLAGNILAQSVSSRFTTSDTVGPLVTAVDPSNTNTASLNKVIQVTFNECVAGIGTQHITLTGGGTTVTGTVSLGSDCKTAIFTPTSPLAADTEYTVLVSGVTDTSGNTQEKEFRAIFKTLDNINPVLDPLQAPGGANVKEDMLFSVTASSTHTDITDILLYINNQLSITIPWPDGQSSVTAELTAPLIENSGNTFKVGACARDDMGNIGATVELTFTLGGDTVPDVTMDLLSEFATVLPGDIVSFKVTASDDVALSQVNVSSAKLNLDSTQSETSKNFEQTYNVDVPPATLPGSQITVTASAADNRLQQSQPRILVLQVPEDGANPVVSLTSPKSDARFDYGKNITIAADASDDVGLKEVRFYLDGQKLATVSTDPNVSSYTTSYTVPSCNEDTPTVIKVEAEDLMGKISEDSRTIILNRIIDEDAPKFTNFSPTNDSLVFPGEKLDIQSVVEDDNGLQSVEFFVDNQLQTTTLENGIYKAVFDVPTDAVKDTLYTIKATAVDVDNKSTTKEVTVKVVHGMEIPHGTVIGPVDPEDSSTSEYENETIIIRGETTVTINGKHTFTNVLVKEKGLLTHGSPTTTSVETMDITVGGQIVIGPGARIDASALGYMGGSSSSHLSPYGRTKGCTDAGYNAEDGSYDQCGGSYGGYGAYFENNDVNSLYGSVYIPMEPGSGGGGERPYNNGGNGGGVISLTSQSLIVDGALKADGCDGNARAGGGSGGSLLIDTDILAGPGIISADGGHSGMSGAGGGGRIALYYNSSDFDLNTISVKGGVCFNDSTNFKGGSGTVYLKRDGEDGRIIISGTNKQVGASGLPQAASGTITALTATLLTDDTAQFIPGAFVGMLLQPNVSNTAVFTVIANTATEIEVELQSGDTDGMEDVAQTGDTYRLKHSARLILEDGVTHLKGTVNVPEIILYNATLSVDGTLEVDGRLSLQGGSTITHSPGTIDSTYTLKVKADILDIDTSSSINADGRGYMGGVYGNQNGYTLTNTNTYGSNSTAGGSYGGFGGVNGVEVSNKTYGSITNPTDPGSGGGHYQSCNGGAGGGVIELDVKELDIDGTISCNGKLPGLYVGAGSGGSILLYADLIKGEGIIRANGGTGGSRGNGGGGRVAVYYKNTDEFNLANIHAYGGETQRTDTNYLEQNNGSAGTVYLKNSASTEPGHLIVDNNNVLSITPKIFPVIPESTYTSISENGSTLTNTNATYMPGSLEGMKLVPDSENPENTLPITGNDWNTITVDGNLNDFTDVTKTYSGIVVYKEPLHVRNTRAHLEGNVKLASLILEDNASLGHPATTEDTEYYLYLEADSITVESGSAIDVSVSGYLGGSGVQGYSRGNSTQYGSLRTCGGSYGGRGGRNNSDHTTLEQPNLTYGSLYRPFESGSGGGGYNTSDEGGSGGGVIRIAATDLVLDGEILSNGGTSSKTYGGGGSGGSIWLDAETISGTGYIRANGGGNVKRGNGGGGRIALHYDSCTLDTSHINAFGGETHSDYYTTYRYNGGAGTVYLKPKNAATDEEKNGRLIVDNNQLNTDEGKGTYSTPLPAMGTGNYTTLTAGFMINDNAAFIPGALVGMKLNVDPAGTVAFTIIENNGTDIFTAEEITGGDGSYAGEHHLFKIEIKGKARLSCSDTIRVPNDSDIAIDPGSDFKNEQ
ncbi:MAG: hypothetical protein GY765_08890 [bacterium]|nr:hypothetical protein [bacterium]